MTVAESPPKGVEPSGVALGDEIPRPRRRRRVIALSVAALTAGAALLLLGRGGTDTAPRRPDGQPQGSRPPASVPAGLNRPAALAAAPDGSVLISNQGTHQILRRSPNGSMEVVVGTGTAGYSGDGGPAVDAEIDTPWGVAVGADGTVYIADSGNNRIRAVSTDGRITSFAGTGVAGSSGDGGPATAANVNQPLGVAVAADGRLFIAEADRVRVVSPEGTIRTLIVGGPASLPVNGQLNAFFPSAIAVTASGDLFVAGLSPKLIAEFDAGGRLRNVWENVYVTLAGLAAAPDGSIVVGDYGHFSIDTIAGSTLSTLAAFAPNSVPGLAGSFRPSGVTVGADGTVYAVTNGVNGGASEPALIAIDARGQVTRLDVPSST